MAQHHPQLLRQLQKWVVSLLLLQLTALALGARRHYWSRILIRISLIVILLSILSACDRYKSDWLQGASCESWLGLGVTTSDLRTEVWLRFRVTAQSGGTLEFPQPQSPRSCWEPSELSKRSGRYHNQLLVMNTGHQGCIQANESQVFVLPHPIRDQQFGNSVLIACDRWYV